MYKVEGLLGKLMLPEKKVKVPSMFTQEEQGRIEDELKKMDGEQRDLVGSMLEITEELRRNKPDCDPRLYIENLQQLVSRMVILRFDPDLSRQVPETKGVCLYICKTMRGRVLITDGISGFVNVNEFLAGERNSSLEENLRAAVGIAQRYKDGQRENENFRRII